MSIIQQYDPGEADESPDNVVPFPTPQSQQQPETLDNLLVMVQGTRTALRDFHSTGQNIKTSFSAMFFP